MVIGKLLTLSRLLLSSLEVDRLITDGLRESFAIKSPCSRSELLVESALSPIDPSTIMSFDEDSSDLASACIRCSSTRLTPWLDTEYSEYDWLSDRILLPDRLDAAEDASCSGAFADNTRDSSVRLVDWFGILLSSVRLAV